MDVQFLAKHLVEMHLGAALVSLMMRTSKDRPASPEDGRVPATEQQLMVPQDHFSMRLWSPDIPLRSIVENHSGTQIPPALGFVDVPVEPGSPISPTSTGTRKSAPRKV